MSRLSGYNNRATKDNPLTTRTGSCWQYRRLSGKRLTYAELTGKVGETQSSNALLAAAQRCAEGSGK